MAAQGEAATQPAAAVTASDTMLIRKSLEMISLL
jgi:hypothetical protein